MNNTNNNIFEDLFVLELSNNHLGSLERGIKIINDFAEVVKFNNIKAAIKLQFRRVDNYIRGVYFKHDIKSGSKITNDDIYLSIPVHKGQISVRELMLGEYGFTLIKDCKKDEKLMIDDINSEYSKNEKMKKSIMQRGL